MWWGDYAYGGDCSSIDFTGVTDIFSNMAAVVALKDLGQAVCWGYSLDCGDCSSIDFTGVTGIFGTERASVARKKDLGPAGCCGAAWYGDVRSRFDLTVRSASFSNMASFARLTVHA